MSIVEHYTLKRKALEAKVSLSEFVRDAIMKTSVVQRLTPEMHAEIRKLSGMANNLNQIARKANALGYDHIRTEYLFLAACRTFVADSKKLSLCHGKIYRSR